MVTRLSCESFGKKAGLQTPSSVLACLLSCDVLTLYKENPSDVHGVTNQKQRSGKAKGTSKKDPTHQGIARARQHFPGTASAVVACTSLEQQPGLRREGCAGRVLRQHRQ